VEEQPPVQPGEETEKGKQKAKGNYSLFNPTPTSLLREFNTDRPDKTESPYTVDAGHFQFEADIVSYSYHKSTDVDAATGTQTTTKTKQLSVANSNFKLGMTNSVDFQVVFESYRIQSTETDGNKIFNRGHGDTTLRVKWNWFGNDGGPIAMGLLPFVKLPTNSDQLGNNKAEGGLILPIAVALPHEWSMGIMFELDKNKNDLDDHYHTEVISSITLSHDLLWGFEAYGELFSQSSNQAGSAWIGTVDTGLGYELSSHAKLDAGVNIGVSDAADDVNPFIGISLRF
jgi:hypothetical protein